MSPSVSNVSGEANNPSQNKTILQGFEWYSSGKTTELRRDPVSGVAKDKSISHWETLTALLPQISAIGLTSIWIPPACKGTGPRDNGYGIYDLYDLGEFDTKGTRSTKWGSKKELTTLCEESKKLGVGIIFDAVLNHKAAADESEESAAVRVSATNRIKELDKKPRLIESWTKFNFDARKGKYSSMKYNKSHFSGVDWDGKCRENAIFKLVGSRPDGSKKDWAKDVAEHENGNYDFLMFADVDFGSVEVQDDVKRWGCWLMDELPGVTGIRLDAIKHYSAAFQKELIQHMQNHASRKGEHLFFVGEYWSSNSKMLSRHIDNTFNREINLFDVKLMYNFHDISTDRLRDLRKVFSNSLIKANPHRAVTFVTNHDTQETQSLACPVQPWFIPHAYALILLRQEGQPCVFWGDLYGTQGPQPRVPACGGRLARLIKARSLFAGGSQTDYFSSEPTSAATKRSDPSCIAWNRSWRSTSHGLIGLVVVLSISWKWKIQKVNVGSECAGQIWTDIMGWAWSGVRIDEQGFGQFPVGPRSISVWTWQKAPGRTEVDGLVYPEETPLEEDSEESLKEIDSD